MVSIHYIAPCCQPCLLLHFLVEQISPKFPQITNLDPSSCNHPCLHVSWPTVVVDEWW